NRHRVRVNGGSMQLLLHTFLVLCRCCRRSKARTLQSWATPLLLPQSSDKRESRRHSGLLVERPVPRAPAAGFLSKRRAKRGPGQGKRRAKRGCQRLTSLVVEMI